MSEETKSQSTAAKIFRFCIKYPINVAFAAVVLYFLFKIYIIGQDAFINKAYLFGTVGLWILWIIAQSFIKTLLLLLAACGAFYGYYYFSHYDEIMCKNNGGIWNQEQKICEEKLTVIQQVQKWWQTHKKFY